MFTYGVRCSVRCSDRNWPSATPRSRGDLSRGQGRCSAGRALVLLSSLCWTCLRNIISHFNWHFDDNGGGFYYYFYACSYKRLLVIYVPAGVNCHKLRAARSCLYLYFHFLINSQPKTLCFCLDVLLFSLLMFTIGDGLRRGIYRACSPKNHRFRAGKPAGKYFFLAIILMEMI